MKTFTHKFLMLTIVALFAIGCASEKPKNQGEDAANASGQMSDGATNKIASDDIAGVNFVAPASVYFNDESNQESLCVAYMNINDIVDKIGFNDSQRKAFADLLLDDIDESEEEIREYLRNTIINLDNSGIKFSEPVYATFNANLQYQELFYEAVIIAQMSDADTLDIAFSDEDNLTMLDGNIRLVDIENDNFSSTLGYNEEYFIIAISSHGNSEDLFKATLNSEKLDLTPFQNRDVALYINGGRMFGLLKQFAQSDIDMAKDMLEYADDEYDIYMYQNYLDNAQQRYDTLNQISDAVGDLKAIAGLTFEDGRIVLDMRYTCENGEDGNISRVVTNGNLKYIPHNAFGFMNIGFNGPAFVNAVKSNMTPDMENYIAQMLDIPSNQFQTVLSVAYDAISSLDGDITAAINNVDIKSVTKYEYGEYYEDTTVDINAIAIADVTNKYIIDNVSLASSSLSEVSEDNYIATLDNINLNIGQIDDDLYLGINTAATNVPSNSVADKWSEVFNDSLGYIVVDIQNIFNSHLGRSVKNNIYDSLEYDEAELVMKIFDMFDSLWLNIHDNNKIELILSFTNTEVNSLEQIASLFIEFINNNK